MSATAHGDSPCVDSSDSFDSAATDAITNAILAGNYAVNGVTFEPFRIKIVNGDTAFDQIWNSERGDNPITFFQSNGSGIDYLPLGDILAPGSPAAAPLGAMLFAASAARPDALAHPTDFIFILDDSGSSNARDLGYWRMTPPSGYSALGIAFSTGSNTKPNPNNYWCVKNQYLQVISYQQVWSDSGQRWHNNGSISAPSYAGKIPTRPPQKMVMLPLTFLSNQDIASEGAWALVMDTADLPITKFPAPDPPHDPNVSDGDTTDCGLTAVKIVPYTAMTNDSSYPNQAQASPFYYVAAEPYWFCANVFPTPEGGSFTISETIGTSETNSQSFSETTSISVSAEFGIEYGPASASVSTSFTREFSLTTEQTVNHSTEATNSVTINYPKQPLTWTWQRQTQIAVFRNDLTQLPTAVYGNQDLRFVPPGGVELHRTRKK